MLELLEREDTEYLKQSRWVRRTLVSKSFANERSAAKKEHLEERCRVKGGSRRVSSGRPFVFSEGSAEAVALSADWLLVFHSENICIERMTSDRKLKASGARN